MNTTEKQEYIIGCVSLLSNRLMQYGDSILPDITFKQWFLLMTISLMDAPEKSINAIAEFVGTTRQNIKKMLTPLERKGYVNINKSEHDARALNVKLTEKTFRYFSDNALPAERAANRLFSDFSDEEIDGMVSGLSKLTVSLETYRNGVNADE